MELSITPSDCAIGRRKLSVQDTSPLLLSSRSSKRPKSGSSTPYKTSNHTHTARSFYQALNAKPKRPTHIKKIRNIPSELLSARVISYQSNQPLQSYPQHIPHQLEVNTCKNAQSSQSVTTFSELLSRRNSQPNKLSKFAENNQVGTKSIANFESLVLVNEKSLTQISPIRSKHRLLSIGSSLTFFRNKSTTVLGSFHQSANSVYVFQANSNKIL